MHKLSLSDALTWGVSPAPTVMSDAFAWGGRRHADALLQNVWRWLSAGDSALHDPGLKAAVGQLQRKVLAQLVADMRRLGARVIAADASSILLATGKRNITAAIGCGFALSSSVASPVFQNGGPQNRVQEGFLCGT